MSSKLMISFVVLALFLSSCESLPFGQNAKTQLVLPPVTRQYAVSADASSSYGGIGESRDDQSPYAATGEPDVTACGDSQMAWVIEEEDDGEHWLELNYDTEIYASGVRVYETMGPGSVVKIEAKDGEDYRLFWEGVDKNKKCPGVFEASYSEKSGNVTYNMTTFKTNTLRVYFDTDVSDWNEIDAVELAGYENRWYMINQTLVVG